MKSPLSLVYQLKVTLKHVRPTIWRRLRVSGELSLEALDRVLQTAMGWENCHLHAFVVHGQRFGPPSDEDFVPVVDEAKYSLQRLVHEGHKFVYEYDFGDGWEHDVRVEEVHEGTPGTLVLECLAGKRACPPEDCGGPSGYERSLRAISNAKTKESREALEWLGDTYDPSAFDIDQINATLRTLIRPPRRQPRASLHPAR